MRTMPEPFALQIYRRYLEGETIQELSARLGIPVERIRQRVQAAAVYRKREKARPPRRAGEREPRLTA